MTPLPRSAVLAGVRSNHSTEFAALGMHRSHYPWLFMSSAMFSLCAMSNIGTFNNIFTFFFFFCNAPFSPPAFFLHWSASLTNNFSPYSLFVPIFLLPSSALVFNNSSCVQPNPPWEKSFHCHKPGPLINSSPCTRFTSTFLLPSPPLPSTMHISFSFWHCFHPVFYIILCFYGLSCFFLTFSLSSPVFDTEISFEHHLCSTGLSCILLHYEQPSCFTFTLFINLQNMQMTKLLQTRIFLYQISGEYY